MTPVTKILRILLILVTIASAIAGLLVKSPLPLATILMWFLLGRYVVSDRALRKFLGILIIGLALSTTYLAIKYPGLRVTRCSNVLDKYLETGNLTKAITEIGNYITVGNVTYLLNQTKVEISNNTITLTIPIEINGSKVPKSYRVQVSTVDIGNVLRQVIEVYRESPAYLVQDYRDSLERIREATGLDTPVLIHTIALLYHIGNIVNLGIPKAIDDVLRGYDPVTALTETYPGTLGTLAAAIVRPDVPKEVKERAAAQLLATALIEVAIRALGKLYPTTHHIANTYLRQLRELVKKLYRDDPEIIQYIRTQLKTTPKHEVTTLIETWVRTLSTGRGYVAKVPKTGTVAIPKTFSKYMVQKPGLYTLKLINEWGVQEIQLRYLTKVDKIKLHLKKYTGQWIGIVLEQTTLKQVLDRWINTIEPKLRQVLEIDVIDEKPVLKLPGTTTIQGELRPQYAGYRSPYIVFKRGDLELHLVLQPNNLHWNIVTKAEGVVKAWKILDIIPVRNEREQVIGYYIRFHEPQRPYTRYFKLPELKQIYETIPRAKAKQLVEKNLIVMESEGYIGIFVKPNLLFTYLTLDSRSKGYIGEYIAQKLLHHRVLRRYISEALKLKDFTIEMLGQPGKPDFIILSEKGKVVAVVETKIRFASYEEAPSVLESLRKMCIREAKEHAIGIGADYIMYISVVLTSAERTVNGIMVYVAVFDYGIKHL